MIAKVAHISVASSCMFRDQCNNTIMDFQSDGLMVEVQYSAIKMFDEYEYVVYSALIIGRKKGKFKWKK